MAGTVAVAVAVVAVDTLTGSLMLPLELPTPLQLVVGAVVVDMLAGLPLSEHLSLQQVVPEEPRLPEQLEAQGLAGISKLLVVLRG